MLAFDQSVNREYHTQKYLLLKHVVNELRVKCNSSNDSWQGEFHNLVKIFSIRYNCSMTEHAPQGYICPICVGNQGEESDATLLKQADLVFKDELVSVWINSFWIKGNEGHVIVVPNQHYENLYDLPQEMGHRIFDISQQLAKVLKAAYQCDGITIRQNNEPAGDQHAFHYHLHIFPRYHGDSFNSNLADGKFLAAPAVRQEYVVRIKAVLAATFGG